MLRRSFLGSVLLAPDSVSRAESAANKTAGRTPFDIARDEDFWREIQGAFTLDRTLINLNNGGVSPSPRVVQDAMRRYLDYSNTAPTYTMWRVLEPNIEQVRRQLADSFGCDPEEMAITRNASESLEICQLGLELQRGDEVLTTDQDYPRMLTTWEQRVRREGIVLRKISFPTPPPSLEDLYQRFEQAVTPRTKIIHFCHITNLTGQIFPVKRICQMARARGIEAIVDGAHAYGQFPFRHSDLDCDYYGTSLHKWLLAPHGTGFLYVRKAKISKLWPLMAAPEALTGDIRKFEEIGTHPAANHNAIAEAMAFHNAIGVERKAARLRYLRELWSDRLRALPGVELRTSDDPQQSCGIGLLCVKAHKSADLAARLFNDYRIIVSPIARSDFDGIRITPNVYTTTGEIETFCRAVEKIVRA